MLVGYCMELFFFWFAGTDKVHEVVTKTKQLIKSQIPTIKKSLSLYLANEETEHILFRPCRVSTLLVQKTK